MVECLILANQSCFVPAQPKSLQRKVGYLIEIRTCIRVTPRFTIGRTPEFLPPEKRPKSGDSPEFEHPQPLRVEVTMTASVFRSRACRLWRQEVRPLLIVLLIGFSIRSSLADWNEVPTGSMRPTILEGDRIFVNKLAYDLKLPFTTWHIAEWGNPQRGDIAVFYSPHDGKRLVKRVVGLPGDTLELRNNTLVINGQPVAYRPVAEDLLRDIPAAARAGCVFATEQLPGQTHAVGGYPGLPARGTFVPIRVPDGQYFMMGDNRDDSFDSRYWGTVDRQQIIGRATAVVLSLDQGHHWLPRWERALRPLDN